MPGHFLVRRFLQATPANSHRDERRGPILLTDVMRFTTVLQTIGGEDLLHGLMSHMRQPSTGDGAAKKGTVG